MATLFSRFINKINDRTATFFNVFLTVIVLWIDLITGSEVQFPLIYVLPVGMAAWRNQKVMAYGMTLLLPLVRGLYEFPWHTQASLAVAGFNTLIEIAALMLYAYLTIRIAKQTRRMKQTITSRELEISQLRSIVRDKSSTLQGRGLSAGMAEGLALIYRPPDSEWTSLHRAIARNDVDAEIHRIESALIAAISELNDTQKQFEGQRATVERDLLDVHLEMLKDVEFWNKCKRRVREDLIKAEQAIAEEVQDMASMLAGLKQEFMRERSADIHDVGRRVLRNFRDSSDVLPNPLVSLPPHTILVAKELLPSDVLQLNRANLVALVTEFGGPSSHVAILARSRNIPAVSDIKDASLLMATGDRLLVDGEAGTVTLSPTPAQVENFAASRMRYTLIESAALQQPNQKSVTKDGVAVHLYANIYRTDEAHLVLEYQLEGVGLYRSEFLFLGVADPPDLDMQLTAYSAVAKMVHPRPVVIRTLDLGGDKIPQFHRSEHDLLLRAGKRGLAFSLTEKKMFRTQLQALLRSAQKADVRIMFPMVMGVADLMAARNLVDEVIQEEQLAKRPPMGAMIETPAAVFHIQEIVKIVDFVSIGTNDLAHFILATDRQSQESSGVLSFMHPAVLRATDQVVRAALTQGVGLTVCGEAAGNPEAVCLLVGMGVRALSINPFRAARVRHVLQQMTLEQMNIAAHAALDATTLEEVQQIAISALHGIEE